MNRFAIVTTALLCLHAAPARSACNCDVYPFQPEACAKYCSSELLARLVRTDDAPATLRDLGYSRSERKALLNAAGDAERVRELLEADNALEKPLLRSLEESRERARILGLDAIQADGL